VTAGRQGEENRKVVIRPEKRKDSTHTVAEGGRGKDAKRWCGIAAGSRKHGTRPVRKGKRNKAG